MLKQDQLHDWEFIQWTGSNYRDIQKFVGSFANALPPHDQMIEIYYKDGTGRGWHAEKHWKGTRVPIPWIMRLRDWILKNDNQAIIVSDGKFKKAFSTCTGNKIIFIDFKKI